MLFLPLGKPWKSQYFKKLEKKKNNRVIFVVRYHPAIPSIFLVCIKYTLILSVHIIIIQSDLFYAKCDVKKTS